MNTASKTSNVMPIPVLHILSPEDKERIHTCVLRLLEEMGVRVENESILQKLADFGAGVDLGSQVARFPASLVETYLSGIARYDWADLSRPAELDVNVGISSGKYLNPETNRHEPWSEQGLRNYVRLVKALPNVDRVELLTSPLANTPLEIQPLFSRALCWRIGTTHLSSAVHDLALCPFIEEFHALHAEAMGIPIEESINAGVFMISPLKFPRTEAEQFLFFAERGYPCWIGRMMSSGGSGPVSQPGAVAAHLAENIFVNIIQHLYYGRRTLDFVCSISPLDMKRGGFCYGRPEKTLANHLFGQMAVYYGASYVPQTGSADAKTPGSEAASQKLLTALPALFCFRTANLRAGKLSIDEVNSPVQMVLDNEVSGALRRIIQPLEVSDTTLAFDTILEAGHGGLFTDKMHTVEHFREEVWDSRLWSSTLLDAWLEEGGKRAEDLALEKWRSIMSEPDHGQGIPREAEAKVEDILNRARQQVRFGKSSKVVVF